MIFGLENYISNPWLRALTVIVMIFVVLKIIVFVIQKIILKVTSKTKNKIDGELVNRMSSPFTILIILIGLRIALLELQFSDELVLVFSKILFSFILLVVAYLAYLIVDLVLLGILQKVMLRVSKYTGQALFSLFQGIIKVVVFAIAIIYILQIWGIEIGPFLAGAGIAGIAVAFAMQESLSNIFGGVSMILDKSIKVGDLVYLDSDTKGKVVKIGLRSTWIRTFDNELMIVPNGKVASNKIQNVALPEPKTRIVVPFSVAYGSDVNEVKKLVLTEIKKLKYFVDNPAPAVRFLEMGDSSLNFKAYLYIDSFENKLISVDEANTRIYNILNKNKIEIPFPQRDVHIKK